MSAQTDLQHFLRLSSAQLSNRIKAEKAKLQANPATNSAQLLQMQMLEELLKEQIKNENTGGTAR